VEDEEAEFTIEDILEAKDPEVDLKVMQAR
jgi:hypothetical protein